MGSGRGMNGRPAHSFPALLHPHIVWVYRRIDYGRAITKKHVTHPAFSLLFIYLPSGMLLL